jgi:hypothetical protein
MSNKNGKTTRIAKSGKQTRARAPGKTKSTGTVSDRTADAKPKKLSALDAAAKVLAETGTPMRCQELIDAMAARGYWTSPKGLTPAATLYAAMQNEIAKKGADARFQKTERGLFALAQVTK